MILDRYGFLQSGNRPEAKRVYDPTYGAFQTNFLSLVLLVETERTRKGITIYQRIKTSIERDLTLRGIKL